MVSAPPSSVSRRGSRFRPLPAERYVHPMAEGMVNEEAEHTANLDVAQDNSPRYHSWIAARCEPHLGRRVLEVGAGTGAITARFAPGREVLAIERDDWCIEEMKRRFADSPNVTVRQAELAQLHDEGLRFDSIVMLNVLEHIEDDVAALGMLRTLLAPGGRIVIYVPALNGMYGAFDRKVGHYRRYAPWRMRKVFAAAGLATTEMRYMNVLSLPAWWIFSRSNLQRSAAGKLSLWDKTGVPLSRALESIVRPPVGLNLFCVAQDATPTRP